MMSALNNGFESNEKSGRHPRDATNSDKNADNIAESTEERLTRSRKESLVDEMFISNILEILNPREKADSPKQYDARYSAVDTKDNAERARRANDLSAVAKTDSRATRQRRKLSGEQLLPDAIRAGGHEAPCAKHDGEVVSEKMLSRATLKVLFKEEIESCDGASSTSSQASRRDANGRVKGCLKESRPRTLSLKSADDINQGDAVTSRPPRNGGRTKAAERRPTFSASSDMNERAFQDLERLKEHATKTTYMREGGIMSIDIPMARKGFIGNLGFTFGGADDDSEEPGSWEPMPIMVESVTRGSVAEIAGMEAGDEIIKINGVSVKNAARSVAVTLIRNTQKKATFLVKKGKGGRRRGADTLSPQQLEELREAFSLYDRFNNGKIHVNNVPKVCRQLGYNESALDFDNAILTARCATGEPDSNKVRFDTFLVIVKEIVKFQDKDSDARQAYSVFDPEMKGYFNIRLLRDAFLASSKRITPLEMAEIFRSADPDLDTRVNEKEFKELLYPFMKMY